MDKKEIADLLIKKQSINNIKELHDLYCSDEDIKNNKDSNTSIGEKYLGHKVYKSLLDSPTSIDFLSILNPDIALEFLDSIDFSKYTIKHFCIAINPVKTKDFKQNKKDIELFMKDKAKFIKQNRTELLYSV